MDEYGNVESTYFQVTEPEEQVSERKEEKAKVLEGIHLLEEIIQHFAERIKFYESTKSIPEDLRTKPDEFMHAVAGNDITADNLRAEKEYLERLRETYSK